MLWAYRALGGVPAGVSGVQAGVPVSERVHTSPRIEKESPNPPNTTMRSRTGS